MKWFKVGKIVNTHGVKGEVRIVSTTDFADERYEKGNKLYIFKEKQSEPVSGILLRPEGYDGHSSGPRVAARLKPPTRRLDGPRHRLPIWCCSA